MCEYTVPEYLTKIETPFGQLEITTQLKLFEALCHG